MNSLFVGHFSSTSVGPNAAASAAGNDVQRQILAELNIICDHVASISMQPVPAWPAGPFICEGVSDGDIQFPGFLNLPVLKHIHFSFKIFATCIAMRPDECLQYNSYLFENLALLTYRWTRSSVKLSMILQDIHITRDGRTSVLRTIRSIAEHLGIFSARRFDAVSPVSNQIVTDFRFDAKRCTVFPGGITRTAEALAAVHDIQLEPIAVYAAALEPYNGVDKLIKAWMEQAVRTPLHIFGKGSLEKAVRSAAEHNPSIVYHGHQPQQAVIEWQSRASWNFCLRYSVGIEERYFFPSKLFNVLCAPGAVISNQFAGIPAPLQPYFYSSEDPFADISHTLERAISTAAPGCVAARRMILRDQYSWRELLKKLLGAP